MARYLDVLSQAAGKNGQALVGATLGFFEAGTLIKLDTFQDEDLTILNTNPVVADGEGRFPDIFLKNQKYFVEFKDKGGSIKDSQDNVTGAVIGSDSLENIAALTALTKSTLLDGDSFPVDSYFTRGDDGGDRFFFNATSTATVDNVLVFATDEGGNGRWFRIRDGAITSIMAGVVDDATDQVIPLQAFFDSGKDLKLLSGNYVSLSALTIPYGVNLDCVPGSHIDFSTATISGNFPSGFCLNAGAGGLTTLPDLSASPAKDDITVTFDSAPGVVQGEIINFNDPTAGSFNGAQVNYRKGEFSRVVRVTGNVVLLDGPLFDSYDHTVIGMSRVDGGTINITGSLEITGVALNSIGTFHAFRLIDSETSGISATNSRNAELSYQQCFNVYGNGLVGQQTILSGLGLQYGLSVSNSQHLYLSGSFSGTRHGSTVGGFDVIGSIVNRDVIIEGNMSSTDGNVNAADHHGNCEFCEYRGIFKGGIIAAGDQNIYHGWASARTDGIAVLMTEMLGWSHDFSGLQMFSAKDPSVVLRGVFDLGGNANAADVNTTRGGMLNLSNIVMEAPIAKRLITIRNRGSVTTESISVNLNGANFKSFDPAALGILVAKVSGDDINLMSTYGIVYGDAISHSVIGVETLLGFEENKTFNQVTVGGAATETFAIVFDREFPLVPKVVVQPEKAGFGTGILATRAIVITKTGFDLVLFLTNGNNLPASNSDINYIASTGTG